MLKLGFAPLSTVVIPRGVIVPLVSVLTVVTSNLRSKSILDIALLLQNRYPTLLAAAGLYWISSIRRCPAASV